MGSQVDPRTVLRGQLGQLSMVTLPRLPMLPFGLGPLGEQGVRPVAGDALAAEVGSVQDRFGVSQQLNLVAG